MPRNRKSEQEKIFSRERWGCCFSQPWSFAKLSWTCRAQRSNGISYQRNRLAFTQPTAKMSSWLRRKFHGLARGHHLTGDPSRPSALTINAAALLKSLTVAPDQYPVLQVAVSQLPPSAIHSSVRNTSQTQIAFLASDGSTGAKFVEAPCPGSAVGATKDFLTLLELFERKRGAHRSDAIGIGAGLDFSTKPGSSSNFTDVLQSFRKAAEFCG
jgi:hypothetical protein